MKDMAEQCFREAIIDAGLPAPDRVYADGTIHRFATNGDPRDDAGWYCLFPNADHDWVAGGVFGCWRADVERKWRMDSERKLTPAESRALEKFFDSAWKQAEELRRQEQEAARAKAEQTLTDADSAAEDHPYLKRKGVKPHGLKQQGNALLVPLTDNGAIMSFQRIFPNGDKRFLKGGRSKGCYFTLGEIPPSEGTIVICEGYATAASAYESTGYPTVCAFSAGNLTVVASKLRTQYPDAKIVIAGDNDVHGKGRELAERAAQTIGAAFVVPEAVGADWNDVHQEHGAETVREQIALAEEPSDQCRTDADPRNTSDGSLEEQFVESPSHGLAADLLFVELGPYIIFERFSARGEGQFFARNPDQSFYSPVFNIHARARSILEKAAYTVHAAAEAKNNGASKDVWSNVGKALHKARTNDFLKSTIQLFSERVTVPELVWNATPQVLPTRTGVLDFSGDQIEVRGAYPNEFFRYPIPVNAEDIVAGGDTPNFDRFVSELFPDTDTRYTALNVASMAVGNHGWKAFVVCTNEAGNNGKNLFFNSLSSLLPGRVGFLGGAVILSGADKGERRFGRAELEGLTLAVFDESSGRFDLGEIKRLTGLSSIQTERKGRDPKDLHPTWAPIALCNQLPEFSPATDQAFLSRLIVLPFVRVFYDTEAVKERFLKLGVDEKNLVPARDPEKIHSEIMAEQPAVIRKLIVEYMIMRDYHDRKPYESERCRRAKEAYRSENDRIESFVSECLERDPNPQNGVLLKRLLELWEGLYGQTSRITGKTLCKELLKRFSYLGKKRTNNGFIITGVREAPGQE